MNGKTNTELDARSAIGPFSLTGAGPMRVAATPGLVIAVRAGAVVIRGAYAPREYYVRAGGRFVAEHFGTIVLEPHGHAELRLAWPERDDERLSPGLEPVIANSLGTDFDARASWAMS